MIKVIRDPIHGYIEIDELAIEIIDTLEMQRLRRIRQLGFSYLVYPGANHTRFEHSLGTYHLSKIFHDRLNVVKDEGKEEELLVAALIHDVGHGPYSHVTEPLMKKYIGKSHEDIEEIVFGEKEKERKSIEIARIVEVLEEHCLEKRKIMKYVKGEREIANGKDFSKILNGEIDIDKMDYLLRDSYYTGVAYGVVDNIRLLQGFDFFEGSLVITEKGILPAEYFLFSRFLMYPSVYYHHTVRIAQLMFSKALEYLIESNTNSNPNSKEEYVFSLRKMDDASLNIAMRNTGGYVGEIIEMINNRRLLKRAVYRGMKELNEEVVEELSEERRVREIEEEISRRAGIDTKYVILDVQKGDGVLKEGEAKVLVGNELRSLGEVSAFVKMLDEAFLEYYKIGVYTKEEHRSEVKRVAEEVLWR